VSETITPAFHAIPAGYLQNAKGHLVLESQISDVDKMRDKLVHDIAAQAKSLTAILATFKRMAFDDIASFIEVSGEQYGAKLRGTKGNTVLYSFDGRFKVERRVMDNIRPDERLQAAKALIDECLNEWTETGREEIKVLILDAFRVNNQGEVNVANLLSLRRHPFKDARWLKAMEAIVDSLQVIGSSSYVRVYERVGQTDKYQQIALDLASV
jgi:hypothetical protein